MKSVSIEKVRKKNFNIEIIKRFVIDAAFAKDKSFWGKESKFAKRLIQEYGLDFLLWLSPPANLKVGTLLWFLAPEGKVFLNEQKFEYAKFKNFSIEEKEITLSETKIGEDIQIQTKPKSLKDFLNLYGQKN